MHVFGASQGESIVLKLPTGGWGVVDCYASSLQDPAQNATHRFLVEQGAEELEFLCLTHPHEDHYRGMSRLLEDFRVRLFWRPAAMSGQRLKWLLKAARIDALRSGADRVVEDADELERLFRLVKESRSRRNDPLIPRNAGLGTQLFPVRLDPAAHFRIWALAPSGNQADRYEERLGKCFDADGRIVDRLPYSEHNIVSMAILLEFGETRLILGGDVVTPGWVDVLNEFGAGRLSAHAVKVSHHGSTNGYCDGLWSAFGENGKPVAVVTSFRRSRLPQRAALEHIREFASRVATPCLPAVSREELPVPLSINAPVRSRKALRDTFSAWSDSQPCPTGRYSLTFDDKGRCVDQQMTDSAGQIPL